jgi:hypothetical protein
LPGSQRGSFGKWDSIHEWALADIYTKYITSKPDSSFVDVLAKNLKKVFERGALLLGVICVKGCTRDVLGDGYPGYLRSQTFSHHFLLNSFLFRFLLPIPMQLHNDLVIEHLTARQIGFPHPFLLRYVVLSLHYSS